MATQLEITNGALVKIGARTISSIDGAEKEAKVTKARFHLCRKAVLRLYPWRFAKSRAKLTPNVVAPVFGYGAAFDLPADYIRVIKVNDSSDEKWEIEGKQILADLSELELQYVRDFGADFMLDPDYPDALFCEILSAYLGMDVSYAITQSEAVKQLATLELDKILPLGRHASATESSGATMEANHFMDSRLMRGRFVRDPGT